MTENEQKVEIEKPIGPPGKLSGHHLHKHALNSAKFIVAPMVDQSELQWRLLSRHYGAHLCYTPMIHSRIFIDTHGRSSNYDQFMIKDETKDRPLIAQFCGNDPQLLLKAVFLYLDHVKVDAVDLNLGCPQGIAKRGNYGAFLMEDWDLIYKLINILHRNIGVPVTAKIRVFEDEQKTLDYARMVESAGAQLITVHGRTREMKGSLTGIADWKIIRKVKEQANVPVFANGNVLYYRNVQEAMEFTGVDGVMTAEGNLYNPAMFSPSIGSKPLKTLLQFCCTKEFEQFFSNALDTHPLLIEHPPAHLVTLHYLDICLDLQNSGAPKTALPLSAIRGHIFKLLRCVLPFFPDFRPRIGAIFNICEWKDIIRELGELIEKDILKTGDSSPSSECLWSMDWLKEESANISTHTVDGVEVHGGYYRILPYWVLQPYIRSPIDKQPPTPAEEQSKQSTVISNLEDKLNDHKQQLASSRKIKKENRARLKDELAELHKRKKPKNVGCVENCGHTSSPNCSFGLCRNCCLTNFRKKIIEMMIQKQETSQEHFIKLNSHLIKENFTQTELEPLLCPPHSTKHWHLKD